MTKRGISLNSQFLFFFALALRYSSVFTEAEDMRKAAKFFNQKTLGELLIVDTYMDMYKQSSSNHVYVFVLKAFPLVCSFAACFRITFSHHREKRDSFSWMWLMIFAVLLTSAFHQSFPAKASKAQAPLIIARTLSYFVEALAIVPQLWMQYVRDDRRQEELCDSFVLEIHLVSRFGFRAIYVGCWLYKMFQDGQGLNGSYAENLPNLAGLLQIMIYGLVGDIVVKFLWRHFRVVALFTISIGMVLKHFGQAMFIQYMISIMLAGCLVVVPSGGMDVVYCHIIFVLLQLYRAGVITFRNPLEFASGKESEL
eukprot:CAMPEP_0184321448 /NCGR_PEP_ID=MMETSP1049-20130417/119130_1 /TAXON_ID=77928 /ORGANISM="Proteomonas sulcata, Strain CCMP704" /LENGTH=310 /DNA_ID=CAMNT_0026642257 /DNA_START=77 /DNA_END=1009 /DNA_ORIENTATION=+